MREKLKNGTLTDEERRRLEELEAWEREMLRQEKLKENMKKLEDIDSEIKKLLDKDPLSDEERLRLLELQKMKAELELENMQLRAGDPPYQQEEVDQMNDK